MLNFTVGPVQSNETVRNIGSENVPYFRTQEFSELMLENESLVKEFAGAPEKARAIFITGSGTASMEAAVMNTLNANDKALIVNGGSFGERFVEICKIHEIPFAEIKLNAGETLKEEHLRPFENAGFTCFLVNIHETSTGVHYSEKLIAYFCKKNNLFLIVDAISSFLADEIHMENSGIDILITGSQKALACPPGISLLILSENALARIEKSKVRSLYLANSNR